MKPVGDQRFQNAYPLDWSELHRQVPENVRPAGFRRRIRELSGEHAQDVLRNKIASRAAVIVEIEIGLAVHKPAGHRQLVPWRRRQLHATDRGCPPGMVVLVQLSQNHVLSQDWGGSVAGIGAASLINPLIILECQKALFESQIHARPVEMHAATIVVAGVAQLVGDRKLIFIGRESRDPGAEP